MNSKKVWNNLFQTFPIFKGLFAGLFSRVIVGNFPAVKFPPWRGEAVTALFWFYRLCHRHRHKNKKAPSANKLPPYFGFTAFAELVTAKEQKTAYRPKITAVWYYRPKSTVIFDTTYKSITMSEW